MNDLECRSPRRDALHVLNCAPCRADARAAAAWENLTRIQGGPVEIATEPSPGFVASVVSAVVRDHTRRARTRWALAAAAALLFFFCAGTGHESATQPQTSPEDSYASLVSPGELAGLIPN